MPFDREKIDHHMKDLARVAATLNDASDELVRQVVLIEKEINRLHLGLKVAWALPDKSVMLGFSRNTESRKWGLYIEDHDTAEQWAYAQAPRWAQIKVIAYIPDLIEAMGHSAIKQIERTHRATTVARDIWAGIAMAYGPPAANTAQPDVPGTPSRPAKRPLDAISDPTPDPDPPETHGGPAKPLTGACPHGTIGCINGMACAGDCRR